MKATELMIGDWVCWNGDDEHTCPIKVDGLSKNEFGSDGDWDDEFESIPLTEEILKLNAFTKPNIWVFTTYNIMSWQRVSEDGMESYIQFQIKSSTMEIQTRVRYVHELQHLFRMCYENELADNFKVE